MSDEELQAIKVRCDAATPGPWEVSEGGGVWVDATCWEGVSGGRADDAAFIAAARTDIPALVVEVEQLRAKVSELEAWKKDVPVSYIQGMIYYEGDSFAYPLARSGVWSWLVQIGVEKE